MRSIGPISCGTISPAWAARSAPSSTPAWQGCTTPQRTAGVPSACATQAFSRASGSNKRSCGSGVRGWRTFSVGASTLATPDSTFSPCWLLTRQSSSTRFLASSLLSTVTVTVSVSPTRTGREKRSACSR